MKDEDRIYYRQRAEREAELARAAHHPNAVRAHEALAEHYAHLVREDVVPPLRAPRSRLGLFPRNR